MAEYERKEKTKHLATTSKTTVELLSESLSAAKDAYKLRDSISYKVLHNASHAGKHQSFILGFFGGFPAQKPLSLSRP